jgi:hypothetical protein
VIIALRRARPIAAGQRRRPLRAAIVLLIVGAAVNLAVAAGLWLNWHYGRPSMRLDIGSRIGGERYSQMSTDLPAALAHWPGGVPAAWGKPHLAKWLGTAPGVRGYEFWSDAAPGPLEAWLPGPWEPESLRTRVSARVLQVGWPLACLQGEELVEQVRVEMDFAAWTATVPMWDLGLPPEHMESRAALLEARLPSRGGSSAFIAYPPLVPTPYLPVRPLALGFTINSLLYASLAAALLGAAGAVRVLWRRHRGRCGCCGYAVLGLATCPECGSAAPAGPKRGVQP